MQKLFPAQPRDSSLFIRRARLVLCLATLLFTLGGGAGSSTGAFAAPGDTKSFVILHTNDQHGHLLPFSYPDRVSPGEDIAQLSQRKNIGGIARRATLVKQIKAREKNVFLFDGGDCMDGTPFSTEFLAKADYDAMNGVGYDYGVLGNHDFNMTAQELSDLRALVKFPLVLANVFNKTDNKPALAPYVLADWDGLKVAIVGLVTKSTQTYKAAKEAFTVRDPLEVAKELVPTLRQQADLVIAVTHDGLDVDQKMAREIPGIDIIVGAHSHTRLPVGAYETAFNPGPRDPKGTIILQAHQWGGELGRLEVTMTEGLDNRWRITRYNATLLPVTDKIADDPVVAQTVAGYWDKIKAKYEAPIGHAAGEFTDARGMEIDSTNYFLVADAVQAATGADFDLENRSGVRAPLLKGPITVGDVIALDPFDNAVVTFDITGRDLKKLITDARPATSANLRYELRREAEGGWRLVSLLVKGKPVDDAAVYRGATNSYFLGANIKPFATNVVETGKLRRDVVSDHIRKNSPISPVEDGRNNFNGTSPYPGG